MDEQTMVWTLLQEAQDEKKNKLLFLTMACFPTYFAEITTVMLIEEDE